MAGTDITWLQYLLHYEESKGIKSDDFLLLLIHWYLIKTGFKCLDPQKLDSKTELLPEGWNKQPYGISYIYNGQEFFLSSTKTDNDMIFNLLCPATEQVGALVFNTERDLRTGSGINAFTDLEGSINSIKDTLVSPFLAKPQDVGSQTQEHGAPKPQYSVIMEKRGGERPSFQDPFPDPLRDPRFDPRAVGRADLDPFARGGGMLFDPFSGPGGLRDPRPGFSGQLPRGSVPPGARFDPIGPLGPRRGPNPDPDHLPPPGYDDMFM